MLQLGKPGGAVSCPSYAFPPGLPLACPVGLHNIRCNYRAENDGVERRAFRRFMRGACPETPHGCRRGRVPNHHTGGPAALAVIPLLANAKPQRQTRIVGRVSGEQARKERVTR
jgi:hypothetical protein